MEISISYSLFLVFSLMLSSLQAKNSKEFTPMVAFTCHKPAMHRTRGAWVKDLDMGCLKDPKDILEYCRHVYPSLDIRNVMEGSSVVKISNWCRGRKEKCAHHVNRVRPFVCVVGAFVADALSVPKNCIFDHIHESKKCQGYGQWNRTATTSCEKRQMKIKRFSMLQACGLDKFTGVEFVCCKKGNGTSNEKKHKKNKEKKNKKKNKQKALREKSSQQKKIPKVKAEKIKSEKKKEKIYFKDVTGKPINDNLNMNTTIKTTKKAGKKLKNVFSTKHQKYIQKKYLEKIKKLNKKKPTKLVTLEKPVIVKAKAKLQKEKLNYKKKATKSPMAFTTFKKMEELFKAKLQKHNEIKMDLKNKKSKKKDSPKKKMKIETASMKEYLNSLQENPLSVSKVLSTLKTYVKEEQRNKQMLVKRYQENLQREEDKKRDVVDGKVGSETNQKEQTIQLKSSNANNNFKTTNNKNVKTTSNNKNKDIYNNLDNNNEKILENIDVKLKEIDIKVSEALKKLEKVPKHGKKMKKHMDGYIGSLSKLDSPHTFFTPQQASLSPSKTTLSSTTFQNVDHPSSISTSSERESNHHTDFSRNHNPVPARMLNNVMSLNQNHPKSLVHSRGSGYSGYGGYSGYSSYHGDFNNGDKLTNPAGIILTSIGLVLIIVIGIVALIKRVNSIPVTNGYLDRPLKRKDTLRKAGNSATDCPPSPDEDAINGYENPTYRYFESSRLVK